MLTNIQIQQTKPEDWEELWPIIQSVIATGETYAFHPESSETEMKNYWMNTDKKCFVALLNNKIVGTYILKENQTGLASHIANASFMVHPHYSGKGIGKALGEHSLLMAKKLGFRGMQFNLVISTNTAAIALWKKLGFQIIGVIPQAFHYRQKEYVDACIMYKDLTIPHNKLYD